jgi:hypothetical protein
VALGGAVHIGCIVPPLTRIPIGWVAVGEPARLYPPHEVEAIRAGLTEVDGGFLPYVFGVEATDDRHDQMKTALARYTRAMVRHHCEDEIIPGQESRV